MADIHSGGRPRRLPRIPAAKGSRTRTASLIFRHSTRSSSIIWRRSMATDYHTLMNRRSAFEFVGDSRRYSSLAGRWAWTRMLDLPCHRNRLSALFGKPSPAVACNGAKHNLLGCSAWRSENRWLPNNHESRQSRPAPRHIARDRPATARDNSQFPARSGVVPEMIAGIPPFLVLSKSKRQRALSHLYPSGSFGPVFYTSERQEPNWRKHNSNRGKNVQFTGDGLDAYYRAFQA